MSAQKSHVVITCDEDWTEHGEGDWFMPNEAHSLAEARRFGKMHAEKLGALHGSFRLWKYAGVSRPSETNGEKR